MKITFFLIENMKTLYRETLNKMCFFLFSSAWLVVCDAWLAIASLVAHWPSDAVGMKIVFREINSADPEYRSPPVRIYIEQIQYSQNNLQKNGIRFYFAFNFGASENKLCNNAFIG